jgi:uncharacterized membrane protein
MHRFGEEGSKPYITRFRKDYPQVACLVGLLLAAIVLLAVSSL